jgi:A/G-specific adenine glycosylase
MTKFQIKVLEYYKEHGRDLPWRHSGGDGQFDPYKIMVSELMLQQTQVPRVIPKYIEFLNLFPTLQDLAAADLKEVLQAWNGLGYNRRAKFLWQAAGETVGRFNGKMPTSAKELQSLPGIGPNTAAAICAYAYDQPVSFIETNIRTVYIHHFFKDQTEIADKAILDYVRRTLPARDYRTWYWALMDYGTFLKASFGNVGIRARGYTKQSPFHGSRRQLRGQILKALTKKPASLKELSKAITDDRLMEVCTQLCAERLIHTEGDRYFLG